MKIVCCVASDAVFRDIETVIRHIGLDYERFPSETALLRVLRRTDVGLIMIDIGHRREDQVNVLSWLSCRAGDNTPVVMLSELRSAELAAIALDAGAEDFIAVPFEAIEFAARMKAVLRRHNRHHEKRTIQLAGFELVRETGTCLDRGRQIELTRREFAMAWLFFSSPGVYISRDKISTSIWGVDSEIASRTIEQHVYKLRKKLHLAVERGAIIRTAYTQGYKLELSGDD